MKANTMKSLYLIQIQLKENRHRKKKDTTIQLQNYSDFKLIDPSSSKDHNITLIDYGNKYIYFNNLPTNNKGRLFMILVLIKIIYRYPKELFI